MHFWCGVSGGCDCVRRGCMGTYVHTYTRSGKIENGICLARYKRAVSARRLAAMRSHTVHRPQPCNDARPRPALRHAGAAKPPFGPLANQQAAVRNARVQRFHFSLHPRDWSVRGRPSHIHCGHWLPSPHTPITSAPIQSPDYTAAYDCLRQRSASLASTATKTMQSKANYDRTSGRYF